MPSGTFSRPAATDSLAAGADLTDKEGYAVKLSSDTAVVMDSDSALTAYGVVQEGAASGAQVSVALVESGMVTYVKLAASPGTVNRGTKLGTHTDGTFKATASTKNYYAVALESGAANEEIEAQLITPGVTS